nr:hypothetical protein [Tanacetum cinerariifolium]
MAISVISVSSNSFEDSMGTPTGRVILFGTIPTTIPVTTPVIVPPTTQIDATTESDLSEDPSSGHIPSLPAVSPFLSSDDDTTDTPRQPIPHGRPYRYHPNGPLHMMTARKRVRPLPVQQLAMRHYVDHSSSYSLSRHSLSDHSFPDLSSTSAGPSRKRRRVERVTHPVMPQDIPEPAQEGATEVTYETLRDLVQRFHDHTQAIPVHRIQAIKGVQREHGHKIVGVESAVTALTERVAKLERDNRRLRGTASVESQRVDRL